VLQGTPAARGVNRARRGDPRRRRDQYLGYYRFDEASMFLFNTGPDLLARDDAGEKSLLPKQRFRTRSDDADSLAAVGQAGYVNFYFLPCHVTIIAALAVRENVKSLKSLQNLPTDTQECKETHRNSRY